MPNKQHQLEKVILAGLLTSDMDEALFEEDMHEMRQLCETAGAEVIAVFRQNRERVATGTYLGLGKLKEIGEAMEQHEAATLIIDAQLAPGQIKAIEEVVKGKVIDRGQLILDIFAMHARTAEAKLQVELAQMRSLYPRLTHAWAHFSQQAGGIGTRGPGEKQLEVDRRLVQSKIADLKKKLAKIESGRTIQRGGRGGVYKAAIVGYTNVGKSSLFNAFCNSSALVENKLFATLDTATKRAWIQGVGNIVVSDTVGLLRKLPHHLVASFRSTLGEVSEAHLLLLVIDASSSWIDEQMRTVDQVLTDIEADKIPRILLFNKIDLVDDPLRRAELAAAWPDALFVSALNKEDILRVKTSVAESFRQISNERSKDEIIARASKTVPGIDSFAEETIPPEIDSEE